MALTIAEQIRVGLSRLWEQAFVDRYRLWRARVHGIEVTQAIQHYRAEEHLTDPLDRGRDNSVHLVAYKAAWVRVYVRAGLSGSVEHVTGTLEVARRNYAFNYEVVDTYRPRGAGTVTARQSVDYDTERNDIKRTLNFVIPAQEFHGTLRLTARLRGIRGAESSVVISARLVQTLRVRAILVAYDGPSSANPPAPGQPPIAQITLPAPTLADVQKTASSAFAAMPVQATGSFASCGTLNWATPLNDMRSAPGACSNNWDVLMNWLGLLRDNDGNRADVVYYGLLPAGVPLGVPGCGRDGLGSGGVGNQRTFLHEAGHGYGFDHTPCGDAGDTDPNYPTYEPYPSASIGEFGLDIRGGAVYDPSTARDYMAYCPRRWMSLYQHERLLQHPRLAPRWLSEQTVFDDPRQRPFDIEDLWRPDPPWLEEELLGYRMNAVISIAGRVQDNGEIQVQSVARVRAAATPGGLQTRFAAQLLDEGGNVIARAPLLRVQHHGGRGCCGGGRHEQDPDRPPFNFKVYVPNVAPGAALRIVSQDKEIWTRQAPGHPPRFVRAAVDLSPTQQLALTWQVESEGDADVWAQWTADGGEHWHGLAVGLLRGEAVLPLTGLPAGRVGIRLLAHDGFFTAESDVLFLELPERPPEVVILHPGDGQTLPLGHPIQVSGNATDTAGNPLPSERLRWTLDGNAAGRGRELWLSPTHAGRHELTLEVDWQGGTARAAAAFNVEEARAPRDSHNL